MFFPTISDRFKGIHQQCVLGVCGGGRVGGAGGLNQENFSFYFSPFFILNLKFFFLTETMELIPICPLTAGHIGK